MKKIISIVLLCTMLLSCFVGCGAKKGQISLNNDVEMQNLGATVDWNTVADWEGGVDESWYNAETYEATETYEIANGDDLRAFLVAVRTTGVTFAGKTVKLTNDIDLGDEAWAPIVSDTTDDVGRYFEGTFDGNNKTIGNFTMTLTDADNTYDARSGNALLGSIGGGAIVKNLSVVNGTYTLSCTSSDFSTAGTIIADIRGGSTEESVTLSGLYSNCTIGYADSSTKKVYEIGGIVGSVTQVSELTIENCTYEGTIDGKNLAQYGGGIIGRINNGTSNATILVTGCKNNGTIQNIGDRAGGIIAQITGNRNVVTVMNCEHAGTVSGKTGAGGGRFVGGIVGYVVGSRSATTFNGDGSVKKAGSYKPVSVNVQGCTVSGNVSGNRCSGGVVGFIQYTVTSRIENCQVTKDAVLNFTVNDGGANVQVGGIIGRLHAGKLYINTNTFEGTMNVTFADVANHADLAVGILLGRAQYDKAKTGNNKNETDYYGYAYMSGNTIAGTVNITNNEPTTGPSAAVFLGYSNANNQVVVGSANKAAPTINSTAGEGCTALEFVAGGSKCNALDVSVIGYQTTKVNNGTYDLRFVASADSELDVLGFIVDIKYRDGSDKIQQSVQTVYAEKAYTSIKGTNENGVEETYFATDYFGHEYLYTLVIKGIPSSYNEDNLGISVVPFGGTGDTQDAVTYTSGAGAMFGTYITGETENELKISAADFQKEAKDAAGVETLPDEITGDTYVKNPYLGVAIVDGAYYPDTNQIYGGMSDLKNHAVLSYTFNVETAGSYDIILHMRIKNESARGVYMFVDGKDAYKVYYDTLDIEADNLNDLDTNNHRYVNILTQEFSAGTHTIYFKIDGSMGAAAHIRGIYISATPQVEQ